VLGSTSSLWVAWIRKSLIYYVMKGSGSVQVDGEDCLVEPGKLILVRAGAEHRFHSITEDLTLLVIFSPAESS